MLVLFTSAVWPARSNVIPSLAANNGWARLLSSHYATKLDLTPTLESVAALPTGFVETQISVLSSPTAMALHPDGRIFVCQQTGALRVIKNGALLTTPFVTLSVDSASERGLLGVAFDPNYATNRFVYLYYTVPAAPIHNRVSRFTADAVNQDIATPGSETVILELNNLSAGNHNGGALHFGPDGKLYVATGENAVGSNAQTLGNMLGKILRINPDPDNLIPSDNPFFGTATGNNRSIWALGLRNPFTFAFQPGTGRMHINDVGQSTWEEVNTGTAGANYGWPTCEGSCGTAGFTNPLYQYANDAATCAITGGTFYNPTNATFPAQYIGKYFFADFCGGWIKYLDPLNPPATGAATDFATGISLPVDLQVANDGSLYYLARGSDSLFRVQYTGAATISINDVSATEGNSGTTTATFMVSLSPASTQTVMVNYATANNTATVGSDYVSASGTLTFAPLQTLQPLSITVNGDTTSESSETFFVNLSNPSNATIADNQGQATIVNDDSAASQFEFTEANYNATESSPSVTITVRRTGDPTSPATVDFKSDDNLAFVECGLVSGAANQRCDYLSTGGTLSFGANELEHSFTVVLFNDLYAEGNETLTLTLSNPAGAGAVLGTLSTATVTIVEDDSTAPTTSSIDGPRYFVRQHYFDFLQRLPDTDGENFWTSQIDQCAPTNITCINNRRIAVSASFFFSLEFAESGAYVYRLYKAAFGEQPQYRPSYAQFLPDRARVVGGATLNQGKQDLANLFVARAEFTTRYPGTLTAAQFVDAILQTVQQGAGLSFTATERQNFINDVNNGGRGLMLKNLSDNAAFSQAVFNRAFVLMQYFGYLRRDPDSEGYDFWLTILNNNPENFNGMVCAFITSQEYQQRFSSVFTRTNASCQ